MSGDIHCPKCNSELSERQLKKLWAEFCGKKKSAAKTVAAVENGRKGGRPVTYMQTFYDSVPEAVVFLEEKLEREKAQVRPAIQRLDSQDPSRTGFFIRCDDILWHCSWDGASEFISITEGSQRCPGISRINYAANRAAHKLVQDISREKLMRMPEDNSDVVRWIERRTRKR